MHPQNLRAHSPLSKHLRVSLGTITHMRTRTPYQMGSQEIKHCARQDNKSKHCLWGIIWWVCACLRAKLSCRGSWKEIKWHEQIVWGNLLLKDRWDLHCSDSRCGVRVFCPIPLKVFYFLHPRTQFFQIKWCSQVLPLKQGKTCTSQGGWHFEKKRLVWLRSH